MKSGFFGPSIIRSGTRLSTSEVKNIYSENQDALDRFSAGRTSKILGDVIGFPAGYIVGYQIGKYLTSNPTVSGRWFGIGSVATVVSILLTRSGINNIRQSMFYSQAIGL